MIFCFALGIVAASIQETIQLDIECFPSGQMIVKNPDETRFKYFAVKSGTGNENCMGEFSDGYLHLLLQNCKLDESIEVIFLGDNTKVIKKGNYAGPYSILCKGLPEEGINLTISVGLHIKDNSSIPTTIRDLNGTLIVTKLGGGVSTQSIEVSEEGTLLRWLFDTPDGFTARPDTCASGSQLLIENGCSVNHEIISDFVQTDEQSQTLYSVTLHTEQFAGSSSSTVVCSMRLCSQESLDNCKLNCGGRRRRRSISRSSANGLLYQTAILNVQFRGRTLQLDMESNSSFIRYDWICVLLFLVNVLL